MSQEKECKWHFDKHSGLKQGDVLAAMAQMFSEKPYNSLVRESIQNSLDAVLDKSHPVKVVFSFGKFDNNDFPNFFGLRDHFIATADYFSDVEKFHKMYTNMYNVMPEPGTNANVHYLRISDYNAKGMKYDPSKSSSPFDSFVRSAGVPNHDDNSSGGAFGFGHSAYFQLSPFRTVIVSTLTKDDQYFFEGTTNIGTHKGVLNGEETLLTGVGYYDNNDGEPVDNSERIPTLFKRKAFIANAPHDKFKYGTDISIIGMNLSNREAIREEMIKSVLENYWFSIYSGKLEVEVDGILVNKLNLNEEIESRYLDVIDPTDKDINPRPYYEAVKLENSSDGFHPSIEKEIPVLGKVKLFTFLNDEAPSDKVIFMRQPKMMVFRNRYRNSKGFYGVFLCEDENGNEKLRKIENSSHTEWKKENYTDVYKNVVQEAKDTESAYIKFIDECKKELFSSENVKLEDIGGEFLPALDNNDTPIKTKSYAGMAEEDGNIPNSSIANKDGQEKKTREVISVHNGDVIDGEGDARIHKRKPGNEKKNGPGHHSGNNDDGDKTQTQDKSSEKSKNTYSVLKEIGYRVIGFHKDGKTYHKVIVNTKRDIKNASIVVSVASEKSTDDKAEIQSALVCGVPVCCSGDTICNLELHEGKNKIDIQLQDNVEHSLNIEVHENK